MVISYGIMLFGSLFFFKYIAVEKNLNEDLICRLNDLLFTKLP
jgi:hypothetical protein